MHEPLSSYWWPAEQEDIQWVPLQQHPVFSSSVPLSSTTKASRNVVAWDGASRLCYWDSDKRCIHRISLRLGEPHPDTILAASPSKVLQPDGQLKFDVHKISTNRNGSALLLSGLEGLCVMYLYGRPSPKENTIICRTFSIGSEIYFNNYSIIRTLQISWHPHSDSHVGILSSDSVFRIFNLSSGLDQPEQEYYLEPIEPGALCKVASICPVSFSFGGDHLWDRFSGPLRNISLSEGTNDEINAAPCEGRAVSFLYDMISKDTILVIAWSSGQLQIGALADEIQPVWKFGTRPHLSVDVNNRVVGVAMICELVSDMSMMKLDQNPDCTVWLGQPPTLLRSAIVDLALPTKSETLITMFVDPIIPERIYCLHNRGIDSIVLHFLPFTNQSTGKDEKMRSPSVNPVLSAPQGEISSSSGLHGFVALSDSFGDSWIVGITSSSECMVLTMETWDTLVSLYKESKSADLEELKDREGATIMSKDLLGGPKAVLLPQLPANIRYVASQSIEGRSALNQYFKIFHENYLEYALKVHFELQHHAPRLKEILDDLHSRSGMVELKLSHVEENQEKLKDRIDYVCHFHGNLEMRLRDLRHVPGAHKKPISKAEQDFKSELDRFTGMELDALRSSLETLKARLKRHVCSSRQQVTRRPKNVVQDDEISKLRSSLGKLALVNSENTKKIEAIESVLRIRDISGR